MYRDSLDALTRLFAGIDDEGRPLEASEIVSVSSAISTMTNGIRRCSVQVLFESGTEYGIEAFGDQAEELHLAARASPINYRLLAKSSRVT